MHSSYVTIAWRNLLKNKIFSIVNIFGLAIGMAACFFIFLFVRFERSYDRFHKNAPNLYRVPISYSGSLANNGVGATNHPAVGPNLKADFPEVINFSRLVHSSIRLNASMVSYTDENGNASTYNEPRIYIADSSFLTMFSFPFVNGDPAKALPDGNSMVISANTAAKYFGKSNPLGKTLFINGRRPFKVTGVFQDVPENSHVKFDILISFQALGDKWGYDEWRFPEFYNYVLLAPGTDPKKLEAKFPAFVNKYLGPIMKELQFGNQFHLQPVTDIHLRSNLKNEAEPNGSEKEINLLSLIGIFILVIAWVNYINLSTAKSIERAKEVGVRKVAGAGRIQLVAQFIMESVIVNLLALIIAVLIVIFCFPLFGQVIGKNINLSFVSSGLLRQWYFWVGLAGIFITGACLVGAYPAWVISAYKPMLVLKGRFFKSTNGILLRKSLVAFQFVLSTLLIAGTITVYRQLSYMQKKTSGYNNNQVVIIKAPGIFDSTLADKLTVLKTELLKSPGVTTVSASSEVPGKTILDRNSVRRAGQDKTHNFTPSLLSIDDQFINTFQMQLAAGRNFRNEERSTIFDAAHTSVLINEVVVKALGYRSNEEAINKQIVFQLGPNDIPAEIIGVVKNYHQRSLKEDYDPILYFYPSWTNWKYYSIRLKPGDLTGELAAVEKKYKQLFPGNAFEYFFLDEYFNRQYLSDQRFGTIFTLFTVLAIFVACLGLYGLSSFFTKLRTKEIGIRKALGASIYSILVLFSKEFMILVALASVIAAPVVYFAASRWLNNYAFHIQLNWVTFLIPPSLLLIIALVTVSVQSLKTALANPVGALRNE